MTGQDKTQLTFRGLVTNPNELAISGDGAFRKFTNGVLTRPALAQARRGIKLNAINSTPVNKLFNYDGGHLIHCSVGSNGILRTLINGATANITGACVVESGRLRSCISGKNFYTAGSVVKRLSGTASSLVAAGGLFAPGFDPLYTRLNLGTSMLATAQGVAYRYLFGLIDAKDNLHLGEPSGRLLVINTTGSAVDPTIRAIVPATATTSHFIQFYRSAKVAIDATDGLYHCDDDLQLVFEQQLSAVDISNGYIELTDIVPGATLDPNADPPLSGEDLRGALIYTAPLARDATTAALGVTGLESANRAPPGCKELCEHNSRTWFANTTQPGEYFLSLLASGGNGVTAGDILRFANLTAPFSITAIRNFGASLTRTATTTVTATMFGAIPHGYTTGDYISVADGNFNFGAGPFQITVSSPTVFTYAENGTNTTFSGARVYATTVAGGLANGTFIAESSAYMTASGRIEATVQNIIAAVNKHTGNSEIWAQSTSGEEDVPGEMLFRGRTAATSSFTILGGAGTTRDCWSPQLLPMEHIVSLTRTGGNTVTATSADNSLQVGEQVLISPGSVNFGAGPHLITSVTPTTFVYTEVATGANVTLAAQSASITPQDVTEAEVEVKPNRVYYSKFGEHEATTRSGWIDVGSSLGAIKVMLSQRGQIWVWKDDGVYRITGGADTSVVPQDIRVEAVDSSLILRAPESVVLLGNRCWGLTDRGVIAVSESGVEVMSEAITGDLTRAWSTVEYYAADLATGGYGDISIKNDSFATAYESEHSYILHLPTVFTDDANPAPAVDASGKYGGCSVAFVFNMQSQTWSIWDWGRNDNLSGVVTVAANVKRCAMVSAVDDSLYLGDGYNGVADDGYIWKERKTLLDGSGGDYRDTTANNQDFSLTRVGSVVTATTGGWMPFAVGDSIRLAVGSANFSVGPHVITDVTPTTFKYTQGGSPLTLANQVVFREQGIPITWAWVIQTAKTPAMEKRWDELKFLFARREDYFPSTGANSQRAFNLALANETASVAAFAVASQGSQISRVWPDAEVARGSRLIVTLTHSTIDEAFDLAGIDFKAEVLGGASTR